jgi:predicted permease
MPEPDVFFRSPVAPDTPRIAGAAGLTRIGASMIGLDAMTIVFTGGVALLTAMLVSLLPAAQASILRPVDALKKGKAEGGARWLDARGVLVTAQIALALILLAGAGLMIRSTERLRETGIGVDPTGLFTVRIDLPGAAYADNRGQQFYAQLLERVSALPGVRSAALGLCAPVSGGCNGTIAWFSPRSEPFRDGRDPSVGIHWITPGFLDTLGVKLLRGRNISDRDRAGQPKVLLVSETAARRLWPNDDPIGKRFVAFGSRPALTVVGVVPDTRYRDLRIARPSVYFPLRQSFFPFAPGNLAIRTSVPPAELVATLRRVIADTDPGVALASAAPFDTFLARPLAQPRLNALLLGVFAGAAVVLAAIGLFGIMATMVRQRARELGVRMALGATARDLRQMVMRRGLAIAATGAVLGVAGALLANRLLAVMLYEVSPTDGPTLALVTGLLLAVAALASLIPARSSTRIDPVIALRAEG